MKNPTLFLLTICDTLNMQQSRASKKKDHSFKPKVIKAIKEVGTSLIKCMTVPLKEQ